jgi:hypothetical protein
MLLLQNDEETWVRDSSTSWRAGISETKKQVTGRCKTPAFSLPQCWQVTSKDMMNEQDQKIRFSPE